MGDEVDVKEPAESSTAEEPSESTFETVEMSDMTAAEHQTWLAKGTVPDRFMPKEQVEPKGKKPAPEVDAAKAKEKSEAKAKAAVKDAADKSETESAEASEKGADETEGDPEPPAKDKQEPSPQKGRTAERRIHQLSDQIQEHLQQKKSLQSEIADLERKKEELAKASTAAKDATVKTEGKLKRPKFSDFDDTDSYDQAMEAYDNQKDLDALQKSKEAVDEALTADRKERAKVEQANRTAIENKKIETSWKKRLDAGAERHEDFADVALADHIILDSDGKLNAVADGFILESPVGEEILYWLGLDANEEERAKIMDSSPLRTSAALGALEARLTEQMKAPAKPKPEIVVTRAPKPATDVSGKKAAVTDPSDAALDSDDFAAYRRAENRKDAEKRKAAHQ